MTFLVGLIAIGLVAPYAATEDVPVTAAPLVVSSALDSEDECGPDRLDAESCAVNALQRRTLMKRSLEASSSEEGCHDMTEDDGGACWEAMMWIKSDGINAHPEWYPGLKAESATHLQLQFEAYNSSHPKCPRPCSWPHKALWCHNSVAPRLWQPAAEGEPVKVKVLSYNLFWWHLYGVKDGQGDSAGRLIKSNMRPAFDVMGFQECEDPEKVLGPVGLLEEYEAFQGDHAICMAYRKKAWALIAKGENNVAQDMRTEFYGTRGVQWMRLRHYASGRILFFMNHHGPLSVNSGGACGGQSTAHNILHVMATKAQVGDLLVLVGDFNANAGSRTIQNLWPHLQHVFNGDSFGGVDNVFSNVWAKAVLSTKVLGHGGSDHDAVEATVWAGPPKHHALLETEKAQAEAEAETETEWCRNAVHGDSCWKQVNWAKTYGIYKHPLWYPGLTAHSSSEEFQMTIYKENHRSCPMPCMSQSNSEGSCHTAVQGELCWKEVQWAKYHGIHQYPRWYHGLTAASSWEQFQQKVHEDKPQKCPPPCSGSSAHGSTEVHVATHEIATGGGLEPRQALQNLEKADGAVACLIEPNTKYVLSGGWTQKLPGVSDPRVCCDKCQGHGGCNTWTWTDWAKDAHGPECRLHGGHVSSKSEDDSFVSGLPKGQAVREASHASHRR